MEGNRQKLPSGSSARAFGRLPAPVVDFAVRNEPAVRWGLSVAVFHQLVIGDLIVDPVTNRLLILRELIVLIFHHSIISQEACDAWLTYPLRNRFSGSARSR
jgi:hypothetical protein